MNTLESYSVTSPHNKVDQCAKFNIDDPTNLYVLTGVTLPGRIYTLSFWLKGDAESSMTVRGGVVPVTTEWTRYGVNFAADSEDLFLAFNASGTYYLYNTQLELGNKATDWTPSPEDVDSAVNNAADTASSAKDAADSAAGQATAASADLLFLKGCIASLVVDENGQSMMTQDGDGWSFNLGPIQGLIDDLSNELSTLNGDHADTKDKLTKLDEMINDPDTKEYVRIHTYNDQPCISLSESDSDYQARITNTDVDARNFNVKNELRHYDFVWKRRENGNLGLVWTEVTE